MGLHIVDFKIVFLRIKADVSFWILSLGSFSCPGTPRIVCRDSEPISSTAHSFEMADMCIFAYKFWLNHAQTLCIHHQMSWISGFWIEVTSISVLLVTPLNTLNLGVCRLACLGPIFQASLEPGQFAEKTRYRA